jgi:anhydro-N-acetylmuramic acid kinase
MNSSSIKAIGLMSGTSLDGLDIAYCKFTPSKQKWKFEILAAETISYPSSLIKSLSNAHDLDALSFWKLHIDFGRFCGNAVKKFQKKHRCKPLLIASHGHTVFHQPQNGFTCQIGDGAQIAALTGIDTICDFRSKDVALNGQGAPLVPIGDKLLFSEADACLNIGGIANISFQIKNKTVAFDVCPANMIFNHYAQLKGKKMDKNGDIARSGKINTELLFQLNSLKFYKKAAPRSLGREWVFEEIIPLMDKKEKKIENKLCTAVEHAAIQLAEVIKKNKLKNILISGGGAYHHYFLERIKSHTDAELIIPDKKTIEFKEALVFALLGVLRINEKTNCLKSVTGASSDNCGGAIYSGK